LFPPTREAGFGRKPMLAYCMMHSIQTLSDPVRAFTEHCVEGIRADEKRIRH
jgi:fumarate hydratase class II